MVKVRYVVLIKGRVQRGGFRSFIKKHALTIAGGKSPSEREGMDACCPSLFRRSHQHLIKHLAETCD
jgi:hypothetical protein